MTDDSPAIKMSGRKRIIDCGVVVVLVALALLLLYLAKGENNRIYEGRLEWRFEVSAFYPNENCSMHPYWFVKEGAARDELHSRWEELGRPEVLRIKFVGDLSRLGRWGHLGRYWREIRAIRMIEVSTAIGACD
jgi:hypothetical protein